MIETPLQTRMLLVLSQLQTSATVQKSPDDDPRFYAIELLCQDSNVQAAMVLAISIMREECYTP